jgi:S-adenosylmethionine synthetase
LTNGEIAKKVEAIFDMRPYIEQRLKLRNPIYSETLTPYGRTPETVTKTFSAPGHQKTITVELFTWEKLDLSTK